MNDLAGTIGGRAIRIFTPSHARLDELGAAFAAEYPALLRFAYFVSGDRDDAQDLVQEAFVRIARAGARVNLETLHAYARRTIANLARSGFRRRNVATRANTQPIAHAELPDVSTQDEMWRAVLTLSPKQRAVIALRFYEDMSERDIAETLGFSAGSVKKHADRAMKSLRAQLGRQS